MKIEGGQNTDIQERSTIKIAIQENKTKKIMSFHKGQGRDPKQINYRKHFEVSEVKSQSSFQAQ